MINLSVSFSEDELTGKYGGGFGQLYLDGKSAGIAQARLEDARNLFAKELMRRLSCDVLALPSIRLKILKGNFKALLLKFLIILFFHCFLFH